MTEPALAAALAAAQGPDPALALANAQAAGQALPGDPRPLALLARALMRLDRLDEADAAIREALAIDPDSVPALVEAAALARRRRDLSAARQALERLVALAPRHVPFHLDLARVAEDIGDRVAALDAWRAARTLAPGAAPIEAGLGLCLVALGRHAEALPHLEAALRAAPGAFEVRRRLIEALLAIGRRQEAVDAAERGTKIDPESVEAARLLLDTLRTANADEASRLGQASRLAALAGGARGHELLADELRAIWDYPAAARELDAALAIDPDAPVARWLRLLIPAHLPFPDAASEAAFVDEFRRGLPILERLAPTIGPKDAQRMLDEGSAFYLHYSGEVLRDELARFGEVVSRLARTLVGELPAPVVATDGDKVRVGFCSRNLRHHTVMKLFGALIRGLDPSRFEVHLFFPMGKADEVTASLRASAAHLAEGAGTHAEWARRILDARLDVLIYVDVGMDCFSTVLAALRLAPVQAVLWGHPVTTGLPTIDAFLSAELMEPPDGDSHYRERLVRLPGIGAAPARPALAPVTPPELRPAREGEVTAFMPQMLQKFGPDFDRILARIARLSPSLRFIFTPYGHRRPTRAWLQRLDGAFQAEGVDLRSHLRFCGWVDQGEWFGLAAASDFALDSFRWSGGVTSLEMFSHDLPIVTLPGPVMRARHTAAMLWLMEIPELIARDPDDYVRIAVELANSADFRAEMRGRIAERKARLYDGTAVHAAFAKFLIDAAARARGTNLP